MRSVLGVSRHERSALASTVRAGSLRGNRRRYIFNVDQAVGATGPNRREDVLLVQYLLAVWMAHEKDPKIQQIVDGAPVVKPDGICGDKTILLNQILFFAGGLWADSRRRE